MYSSNSLSSLLVALTVVLAIAAGSFLGTGSALAQNHTPPAPLAKSDFIPPLSADFHAERRRVVLDALPDDAVAIFFSSPQYPRIGDVDYPFHQDPDLYYLTGATAPGTVLLLAPGGLQIGDDEFNELLFVPDHRRATGRRWLSVRHAETYGGLERAVSTDFFERLMMPVIESDLQIYHLPLPEAVVPGTELGGQLAFFTEHTQLVDFGTSPAVEDAVASMLAVDFEPVFQDLQEYVEEVLGPESFTTPLGEELYRRFVQAGSLAEWEAWRDEEMAGRFTDASFLRPLLTEMRVEKTAVEQNVLAEAGRLSAGAMRVVMQTAAPGRHEYELQAMAEFVPMREAGARTAFSTTIRSGPLALHKTDATNRRQLQSGELVLAELGAEHHGYASTVVRTLPVDPSFTEEQRTLYQLVADAHSAALEAAVPGAPFRAPEDAVRDVLSAGLMELGIIDSQEEVIEFLPGVVSHYVGLQVRDVGFGDPLSAGHVIAIGPGLFIPESEDVDPNWWNIAIRIQDMLLITDGGHVNLTEDAPVHLSEVEALRQEPFPAEMLLP